MRINHNIAALNTYRQLTMGTNAASKSMEKLSSGLRINRAGDDAAGLAISEKMRGQIRGLEMAAKNSQDAISLIQTAEGALNETHAILQRMRELATQAANDTNTESDRAEIQKEINQLTSEINRIGNTTEFNTKKLLNGDLSSTKETGSTTVKANSGNYAVTFATGVTWSGLAGEQPTITSGSGNANQIDFSGSVNAFDWSKINATKTNTLTITRNGDTFTVDISAVDGDNDTLTVDADKMAFDSTNNKYTYNANGVSFEISGEELDKWTDGASVTIDLSAQDATGAGTNFDLTTVATKSDFTTNNLKTSGSTYGSFGASGITVDNTDPEYIEGVAGIKITGTNLEDTSGSATYTIQLLAKDGTTVLAKETVQSATAITSIAYDEHGISFTFNVNDTSNFEVTKMFDVTETNVTEDASATFQIGANAGQSMSVSISDMRALALEISSATAGATKTVKDGQGNDVTAYYIATNPEVTNGTNNTGVEYALDISTAEKATAAIAVLDEAIASVSAERSKLGAYQNRLEHTINNLGTAAENLTAAESRIRDVDYALAA